MNCLYLDGEMASQDVQDRLPELEPKDRLAKLFILCDAHAHALGLRKANLLDARWREEFRKNLLDFDIKL